MNFFQSLVLQVTLQKRPEAVAVPAEITFMQPAPMTVGDADQLLQVASINGETPIVVASADESVAIVINGALRALKAGSIALTATQVAGGGYLAAEPVTRTVTISAVVTPPPEGKFVLAIPGDSRVDYSGDTLTNKETSVSAFANKRFADVGISNMQFLPFCYPGATAEQVEDPNYVNTNEYACAKPQGISASDYLLSFLSANDTNYVSVAFGANVGSNDLQAIKAMVAKYKASSKVAKVFVQLVLPRLGVNFDTLNAAIRANIGNWHDGYIPLDEIPQVFSPEVVDNPGVFWKKDFVPFFHLSGVHLTDAGNKFVAEGYSQFISKQAGFTLPPMVSELVNTAIEQTSLHLAYSPVNAWSSYVFNNGYANYFAGYSGAGDAKISFKAKFYGVQYISPKNSQGADVELWIDGAIVDEGTTFATSAAASGPVLQKVFTTLAEHTVEVRRKAGTSQPGMFADQFRFANSAGVFPSANPQKVMVPIPDHADGSVETVAGVIATTNNSAGGWNSGVHMDTFTAPTGTSAVKIRVGALSTQSAVVFGIGPAGDNNSSPKYNYLQASVYYDLNNIVGMKAGGNQGAVIPRDKNRVNDIWLMVYADKVELYTNLSTTPHTTFNGVNTGTLQVFAALEGDSSQLEAPTIEKIN